MKLKNIMYNLNQHDNTAIKHICEITKYIPDYKSWPLIVNRGHGLQLVATDYKSWTRITNRGHR